MCGIAGYFTTAIDADTGAAMLARMSASIQHRGPDDHGFYVTEGVGLAIRRLSIIDVEGGHQPFSDERAGVHLVFNGEIYNHLELRKDLESRGRVFRTRCDTEVILHTYLQYGVDGFERFNGMFAIAVWDARAGRLHLVRDRLGVKPLYYAWNGKELLFASEIKAIMASGRVAKRLDERALADYLTFRYVPGPRSIWCDVFKLQPGHRLYMDIDRPQPHIERYWDIPSGDAVDHRATGTLREEFAELFVDAVNLRMLADVPVGITLSGGLDSSAVAAVAARSHGANIAMFTVAFEGAPETDERAYARIVGRHVGAELHEVVIGEQDFLEFLPRFVSLTDEPMADLASVPLHYVSRLARERVKVVLSGEGSDEILGGYNFEVWVRRWDEARRRGFGQRRWRAPWRRRSTLPELDLRTWPTPLNMTNYYALDERRALFAGAADHDSLDVLRADVARAGAADPLQQALYVYCQGWLVEDLLMKADRMSMGNSLELRTPFLDYRLVEWAARAPASMKVGAALGGEYQTKRVLREFARGLVPETVLCRSKKGFPVPVYDWLSGRLQSWVHDLLGGTECALRDWLSGQGIEETVVRGTAESAQMVDRHRLWNLIVLELWMREWRPA